MTGIATVVRRACAPLAPAPLTDPRWTDLLGRAPDASPFHHPAWAALLRRTYGYPTTACWVADARGRVVAGVPIASVASRITGRRLVALPFADLCDPLVAADAPPGAAAALADALTALQARADVPLEIRGTGAVLAAAPAGERFHHHVLDLEPDVEAVVARFTRSQVMRGVRRARREGLEPVFRTDRAALDAFYRLHVATRRRLGVPTQPRRFVLGLERLFDDGLGFVLLVLRDGRPIAAAVFLTHGETMMYKYGASDERHLRARPNNLLFFEAVRRGCETGMRRLDFGRTHEGHESLRAFKLAWGAREHELRYRYVGGRAPGGRNPRTAALLRAVIRRSPPVAGRVIGEVLYRHAG